MDEFILHNHGGKEPGMIVTKDNDATELVVNYLVGSGFSSPLTLDELLLDIGEGGRITITESEIITSPAKYYDVVYGFSSGAIDFDGSHLTPFFKETNFVLVLSVKFIESELELGRDWPSLSGLTYQYLG